MYPSGVALGVLLIKALTFASIQLPSGLTVNAAAAPSPPRSTFPPENPLAARFSPTCTVTVTTFSNGASDDVILKTETSVSTSTLTLTQPRPPFATENGTSLLLRREASPCSGCVERLAENVRAEARLVENASRARNQSATIGVKNHCTTFTLVKDPSRGGDVGLLGVFPTSTITTISVTTETQYDSPGAVILTSTSFWETSEDSPAIPSSGISEQPSSPTFPAIQSDVGSSFPSLKPTRMSQPSEQTTTEGSSGATEVSSTSIAPSTQTPPSELTSLTSTESLEQSSPSTSSEKSPQTESVEGLSPITSAEESPPTTSVEEPPPMTSLEELSQGLGPMKSSMESSPMLSPEDSPPITPLAGKLSMDASTPDTDLSAMTTSSLVNLERISNTQRPLSIPGALVSEPTLQQTTPEKQIQTIPLTSSVQSQDTLSVETLAPNTALPAAPTDSPTELEGTDNAQPSGLLFTAPSLPSSEPVSRQTKSDLQMQAISWLTSDQSRQQAAYTSDIFPTPNQEQNSATSVMPTAPPVTTLGTNTFVPVAPSSVYVIDSQTLAAGGPAVTIFSSVLSLAADGDELLIAPTGFISNGQVAGPASTIQLSSNPSPNPLSAPAPIITTIGNSPITIPPFASSLVLTPSSGGSPVTLLPSSSALTLPGGTIISLSPANPASPSASPPVLIISSSGASFAQSITFPTPVPSSFPASTLTQKYPTQQPTTILGPSNLPIVMSGDSSLEVGGVTFSPGGPAATISGIAVSLGTSNSMLVVGSSTIAIAPTATGIGGDIYSELVDEEQTPNATNSGMTTSTLSTSKNSTANESGSESGPQATDSSVLLSNDALKSMMPWTKVMSGLLGIFLALFTL